MKCIPTALAAAGMAGIANAAIKPDRRQVDPYTCACGPEGGPKTVTVTQTVSVTAYPSGYGGGNVAPSSSASPSTFTLPDRPGTYTNSVVTITVTRPGGQTETTTSSTAVPANSTIVSPIRTSIPAPPLPETTYTPSVVTITVTDAVGQSSVLTMSTEVPVTSQPYYSTPGNSSMMYPWGSAPPPASSTEVSPTMTSALPPGLSVTERTSTYVTTCSEETTVTSGSHTFTTTGTSMVRSTITSTIQSTVTDFIPGQSQNSAPIETGTSSNGTRLSPVGATSSPIVLTRTVTPIEAPSSTVALSFSATAVNTTRTHGVPTYISSTSPPSFSFVPITNTTSLTRPETQSSSYSGVPYTYGLPSTVSSNTMVSSMVPSSVENSPVQTSMSSGSPGAPPGYGGKYSPSNSSELSPVQTSMSSVVPGAPPGYGGGYSSSKYPSNNTDLSPVQTSMSSGIPGAPPAPSGYGGGYISSTYPSNNTELSPVQTSMSSNMPNAPSGYGGGYTSSTYPSNSSQLSPVQTSMSSGIPGAPPAPSGYGGGYTSSTYSPNSTDLSPVGATSSSVPASSSPTTWSYEASAPTYATYFTVSSSYAAHGVSTSAFPYPTTSEALSTTTFETPSYTENSPVGTSAPSGYQRKVIVSPIAPESASIPGLDTPVNQLIPAQTDNLNSPGFVSQPGASACNLAPAYGAALTNLTTDLPSNSLALAIPQANINAVIAGLFITIDAALEANVEGSIQLQAGATLPTALPTVWTDAAGESHALNYQGGMTLANILDWCAYLVVQVYVDAGTVLQGFAEGSMEFGGNLGTSGTVTFDVDFSAALGTDVGAQGDFDFGAGVRGGLEGIGELIGKLDAKFKGGVHSTSNVSGNGAVHAGSAPSGSKVHHARGKRSHPRAIRV